MALVDCTIVVEASQVEVSTAAAVSVTVSPATTQLSVEGLAGIRGPAGESAIPENFFQTQNLLSELDTGEKRAGARVNLGVQDAETDVDFTFIYQLSK